MKWMMSVWGLLLLTTGCKKWVQYSPSEIRLQANERNLNEKNIERLLRQPQRDTFRFVVIGDSQRFYDELEDFVNHVNRRSDISLVLLNGDITDFGQGREFQWIYRILNRLSMPYVGVIGNHDMLGNGRRIYQEMFGPENFTFTVQGNRFVCLNTNSKERGFDGTLPDLGWMRRELADSDGCQNLFVLSHIPPFSPDFDQRLSQDYAHCLASNTKARYSIHSHQHNYSFTRPYDGNVDYLVTSSMNKRNYVVVTVVGQNVSFERVDF